MNTLTVLNRPLDDRTYLTTVSGSRSSWTQYLRQLRAMDATPDLVAVRCTLNALGFVAEMIFKAI